MGRFFLLETQHRQYKFQCWLVLFCTTCFFLGAEYATAKSHSLRDIVAASDEPQDYDGVANDELNNLVAPENNDSGVKSWQSKFSGPSFQNFRSHFGNKNDVVHTLKTDGTLSEKLHSIQIATDVSSLNTDRPRCDLVGDFAERLRREEQDLLQTRQTDLQRQDQEEPGWETNDPTKDSATGSLTYSWPVLATIASSLLFTTVYVHSPAFMWSELAQTLHSVISLYSFRQYFVNFSMEYWRPANDGDGSGKGFQAGDLIVLVAHAALLQPETRNAIQTHVWPAIVSSIQTILIAETWSYVWKWIWEALPMAMSSSSSSSSSSTKPQQQVAESTNSSLSSKNDTAKETAAIQPQSLTSTVSKYWTKIQLHTVRTFGDLEFWDRLLQRGTRRMVQKAIQKHVQEFFGRLASRGVATVKETIQTAVTTRP